MYKTKEIEPLIRTLDSDTVRRFDLLVKVSKGFIEQNQKALEMDRLLLAQLQKEVPERLPAHLKPAIPQASSQDALQAIADKLAAAFAALHKGAPQGQSAVFAGKVGTDDLTDELRAKVEAIQKVQYQVPGRSTPVLPKSIVPDFQKIVDDVMLGQNVMLVGGAGTGKTTLAQAVADALGRPYITINCSQWTAPTEIIGGQTIEGYQEGKMIEAWRNGWMLILDELPKLDPNTAGLFNDALAKSKVPGGKIFNARKEGFERHPDFCCIATGNVYPNAESVAYGANNKQDLSLLDRFAGSVYTIEKNPELEKQVVGSATLWAWCNTVREVIEELRYEAAVSLRWMQTCRDTLLLELERFERGGAKEADTGKTLGDCFESFCRQGFTAVQQETLRERCRDKSLDLASVYAHGYRQQPAWKQFAQELTAAGMLGGKAAKPTKGKGASGLGAILPATRNAFSVELPE